MNVSRIVNGIMIGAIGIFAGVGCSSAPGTAISSVHRSLSCVPAEFIPGNRASEPPDAISTPLEMSILSKFAIFRRGAHAVDKLPTTALVGGTLSQEIAKTYKLSSYYPAYVRRLDVFGVQSYFVIPGFGRPEPLPSSHCLAGRARQEFAARQRRRLIEPVYCIIAVHSGEVTPVSACVPFAAVVEGGDVFRSVSAAERVVELVPDGVGLIRVNYRSGPSIVSPVHENTFSFRPRLVPSYLQGELNRLWQRLEESQLNKAQRQRIVRQYDSVIASTEPTSIEWIGSSGRRSRLIKGAPGGNTVTSVGSLRAPIEG